MGTNLQENLNHHMTVARALFHDIKSEAFYGTIRALLTTIQIAKKQNVKLTEPPDLVATTEVLIRNSQLTIDLAIVAGKINCLTKVFIQKSPITVQDLLAQTSQIDEKIPKICMLFGIVDCLPSDKCDATVVTVAEEILKLLQDFNSVYFHQMKLLQSWLQFVRSIVSFIPSSDPVRNFLLPQSAMMEVLNLHWETIQVQTLPEQCLTTVCDIWRNIQPTSLFADIVAKFALTNLTWKSKTKYLILATLLPFTHFSDILCEYPDTIYAMTASLDSNCLLPAGTAVFKALTKHLTADEWEDYCQSVLLDALKHSTRTVQVNAVQYWLPCLSHASPVVRVELKERLLNADNFNWLAYVSLLKLMGHIEDNDKLLTHRALNHGEEEVRATAFGILLHANKKTETVRAQDWDLMQKFLLNNLRSNNPQFRFKLLSTTRLFLIRVLESCLSRIKTDIPSLNQDIERLRQLHDSLLECLTPLSSYQRKVASLGALRYIHQLFGDSDAQADSLAKGASLTRRRQLIELAGDRWNWTGNGPLDRYTVCILDEIIDVRQKAYELLRDFFHFPPPSYVRLLYQKGIEMCDSAKFQKSECAHIVIQLIGHWTSTDSPIVPELTVDFLVEAIRKRFEQLKLDWMFGASQEPIHGYVGALVKVLQLPYHQREATSYTNLIELSQSISCYMLDSLGLKSTGSPDMAPSFEEMSQSIDEIVRRSNPTQSVVTVSISVQQQLVLACAWLNLKETGNLAVQVATLLLNDTTLLAEERVYKIEQCAQIVYQILVRCRHKGAIEAAGEAMFVLCRRLFTSREEAIRAIPGKMLMNFLQRLENLKVGASITRRSAGLAFLVCKIVSSQPEKSLSDSLLAVATRRLISVAQRPVETNEGKDEICDLPQSVAMHLLKSLVHDSSLSVGLQPELMEPIVRLSVDSFAHPHWSVRNAALQLHGSVIPRLVGLSSKTTTELFHKLPGLESFFLEKLSELPEDQQLVTGGLIPTLSILSRLAPGHKNESLNSHFASRLLILLGHAVVQVRQLAAQSLLAFVSLFKTKWATMQLCEDAEILAGQKTLDTTLNICVRGCSVTNSLHGCLLAVLEFLRRCRDVALSVEDWEMIRKSVSALIPIEKNHPSYFIKLAVLKIFQMLPNLAGDLEFYKMYRDETVRKLYQHQPGFGDWLRLKTELVVNHISLNCMLPAIEKLLPYTNGMDMVETALKVLKNRLARLSSSSILANTVTGFVTCYINLWHKFPSLLPVCLDFVLARGAGALQESDTSLRWYVDFFLDKCIETRQFGSTVALLAIPTTSAVIKETIEKNLIVDGLDDIVLRLSRCLLDASEPEESLSFRSAAASSLKTTGKTLVQMCHKNAQISGNIFLLVLNLIQDEEKEVRTDTAFFLTDLLSPLESSPSYCPRLVQMSPILCLENFAYQINHWFTPQHLIPVIFDLLKDPEITREDIIQPLYDREPRNFFQEETETIHFLVKVVESLSTAIVNCNKPFQLDIDVNKMIEEADKYLNRIQSDPFNQNDIIKWLFIQSSESYSILARLSARLTIITLCCPSEQASQRIAELQQTIRQLNRCYIL